MTTKATPRKINATIAALDWVGAYEAENPFDEGDYSITLADAFEAKGTAAKVKAAYPDFPADLVDAFAMLRNMSNAQLRNR